MVTSNTRSLQANGDKISRKEVIDRYLKRPPKPDIRRKYQRGGYWEVPDRNFTMGGSLKFIEGAGTCSVTLRLGFGIRYTQYLLFLPFELYDKTFDSSGVLDREYLELLVRESLAK